MNFRFSAEEKLFNELLGNKTFNKISEEALQSISLQHKHIQTFDLISSGLEVTKRNSPTLSKLLNESKEVLNISKKTKVTMYVHNSPEVNAGCIFLAPGSYAVFLNAGIINLMEEEELKFVIGHELGHLKFEHHKIIKQPGKSISPAFTLRLFEHSRYAEISADRCGYIACDSLKSSRKALLKLAVGTKLRFFDDENIDTEIPIKILNEALSTNKNLIEEKLSHPYSILRVFALESFAKHHEKLKRSSGDFKDVDYQIYDALEMLNPNFNSESTELLALGSLWVSYADKKNLREELKHIESICDPLILKKVMTSIKGKKDKIKALQEDFARVTKQNKNKLSFAVSTRLIDSISSVAIVDNNLGQTEVKALEEICKLLGLNKAYLDTVIRKISKNIYT